MTSWIKYKNGVFGGVYEGDEIRWPRKGKEDIVLDLNTDDQVLFTYGILRLKKEDPAFPNRPYRKFGPKYEFVHDGKAEVVEKWEYLYDSFDDIKRNKIHEWYMNKDTIAQHGVTYNGRKYDIRFRNVGYLSMLGNLISLNEYPEDFHFFDSEGNVFPFSKEDCIGLIKEIATAFVKLEEKSMAEYKHIVSIKDIDELCAYQVQQPSS